VDELNWTELDLAGLSRDETRRDEMRRDEIKSDRMVSSSLSAGADLASDSGGGGARGPNSWPCTRVDLPLD